MQPFLLTLCVVANRISTSNRVKKPTEPLTIQKIKAAHEERRDETERGDREDAQPAR